MPPLNTPQQAQQKEIQEPNYDNAIVKEIERKFGQYVFAERKGDISHLRFEEKETTHDNGAKYVGEWNVQTGLREGRGTQVWMDGSKYEGSWVAGKANGKGRLIHADGDVYEGDWVDDKAQGYGVYTHMDGTQYRGYW